MIMENSRYFGRDVANHQKDHGHIVERTKKPFSMIPKLVTSSIDDKENRLFRRNSEKMEEEPIVTDFKNPQLVAHYANEILSHIHHEEVLDSFILRINI